MRADEISRRALAAVARLTIIAGAAGCSGAITIDKDAEPGEIDPGDATPNEPPDATVEVPEKSCFDGANDSAACCNKLLTGSFADGKLYEDPTLATDEEKACCDLAVTTMDAWTSAEPPPFDYNIPNACCGTGIVEGGWEAHPSCTPWGPPMPPVMPRHIGLGLLEVLS